MGSFWEELHWKLQRTFALAQALAQAQALALALTRFEMHKIHTDKHVDSHLSV